MYFQRKRVFFLILPELHKPEHAPLLRPLFPIHLFGDPLTACRHHADSGFFQNVHHMPADAEFSLAQDTVRFFLQNLLRILVRQFLDLFTAHAGINLRKWDILNGTVFPRLLLLFLSPQTAWMIRKIDKHTCSFPEPISDSFLSLSGNLDPAQCHTGL